MSITPVQSNSGDSASSVSTIPVTLPTGATLGNLLVVTLVADSIDLTEFTPPTGWNQAASADLSLSQAVQSAIFYLVVGSADAGVSSWSFGLRVSHRYGFFIQELSATLGWAPTPVDSTGASTTTTTSSTMDGGTCPATTYASEYWISVVGFRGSGKTISSVAAGWTNETNLPLSTSATNATFDQIATATGTPALTFHCSAAEYYNGCTATFYEGNVPVYGSANLGMNDVGGAVVTGFTPVSASVTMGGGPHGMTIASYALASLLKMGGGPHGLKATGSRIIFGISTMGGGPGGLSISLPKSSGMFNVGTLGGGLLATANVIVASGKINMGGFALIWNAAQGGIAPFYGWVGEPLGSWQLVTVWRWRVGVGWVLVTTKRWKAGSWHQL